MSIENNKILIAYHTSDDQPLTQSSNKGWVTHFYRFLYPLVEQISGEKPQVEILSEKDPSLDSYRSASVLVAILSKEFLNHKVLMSGVKLFAATAKKSGTWMLNGTPRLFKVFKSPIEDADTYLSDYADLLPYDFYYLDPLTGKPHTFKRFFGHDAERHYWMKMIDLSYDIHYTQQKMTERSHPEEQKTETPSHNNKTIYLATSGIDMIPQRDSLKRELMKYGYTILPNQAFPKDLRQLEQAIRHDLSRACLSIHLVGEDYGHMPTGTTLSLVDIQNRIASNYIKKTHQESLKNDGQAPFNRLIWLSPELKNVSERQKIFIDELKGDAAQLDEAELLQIPLEELKYVIREKLTAHHRSLTTQTDPTTQQRSHHSKQVYLICDLIDQDAIPPVINILKKHGLEVTTPKFEGSITGLRHIHQENLRTCDASFIYFGKSSREWLKTKLQDFIKAPGFGRTQPMLATAIFAEDRSKLSKLLKYNQRTIVLEGGDLTEQKVAPFVHQLQGK